MVNASIIDRKYPECVAVGLRKETWGGLFTAQAEKRLRMATIVSTTDAKLSGEAFFPLTRVMAEVRPTLRWSSIIKRL